MEKSREYDSYFTNIEIHTHLILKIHELLTFFQKHKCKVTLFFFWDLLFYKQLLDIHCKSPQWTTLVHSLTPMRVLSPSHLTKN